MIRQEFDLGDLVQFYPTTESDGVGIVTASKLINKNSVVYENKQKWHPDEYHCRVKLTDGEIRWIRAKWLKMISKAENN